MPEQNHPTIAVLVKVDVDEGIAAMVEDLQHIDGVRTHASCQGTIGEGGPHPYPPQVLISATPEARKIIEQEYIVGRQLVGSFYVHPKGYEREVAEYTTR
jgi:hypothetical protein